MVSIFCTGSAPTAWVDRVSECMGVWAGCAKDFLFRFSFRLWLGTRKSDSQLSTLTRQASQELRPECGVQIEWRHPVAR